MCLFFVNSRYVNLDRSFGAKERIMWRIKLPKMGLWVWLSDCLSLANPDSKWVIEENANENASATPVGVVYLSWSENLHFTWLTDGVKKCNAHTHLLRQQPPLIQVAGIGIGMAPAPAVATACSSVSSLSLIESQCCPGLRFPTLIQCKGALVFYSESLNQWNKGKIVSQSNNPSVIN